MENSMEFHGTRVAPNQISPCLMEFHGIFHEIAYSICAIKSYIIEFYEIPWNFVIVILLNIGLPWTSMGYSMKFHGTLVPCHQIEYHPVPWNSMEH